MKKLIIIFSFYISIAAVSCGSSTPAEHSHSDTTATKTGATAKKYTCPMDADIIVDKPGTCPKCKMKLVEKSS